MRIDQPGCTDQVAEEISTFSDWVLGIGDGQHCSVLGDAQIPIPQDILAQRHSSPIEDIVNATYPNLEQSYKDIKYLQGRAILAPHHEMVDRINNCMLNLIPGQEALYPSSDSIANADGSGSKTNPEYPIEFLNTIKPGGLPNHGLILKVGVPILLLRNIDQTAGLCNGTRLVIRRLGQWNIQAEILTGTSVGDQVFLPRVVLTAELPYLNFTLKRRQYPIALCFAMTINKSQGQSLEHVGLCLQHQVFCHGQLYVAISRVTSRQGLKILSSDEDGEELFTMKNIVYREVLNHG
ncbi:unnamed protein product [Linum tenue]|uniref:ATP-dependent DNA helicase n=1 Tax=Linum tenue TaxID=586396 RepID=A0AAV0KKY6_9ROSI|nr:unnamed protein product [Linum tenue]